MKINKKIQFQIGETFQFGLVILKCIAKTEETFCNNCFFRYSNCINEHLESVGPCVASQRRDKTDVIFVKSED